MTLFSAPEARDMLLRAREPVHTSRKSSPFYQARKRQWRAAVVGAASCLAVHGDEADVPRIVDAMLQMQRHEGYVSHPVLDLRSAIARFVIDAREGSPLATTLAAHPSAHVRLALIEGLSQRDADTDAKARLVALACDHDAWVRASAREAAKEPIAPWTGIFSHDPLDEAVAWARSQACVSAAAGAAKAAAAEAEARALVTELCDTFGKHPSRIDDVEADLAARCALLPDTLALDLTRHAASLRPFRGPSPLVRMAVARDGGAELFVELVRRWIREEPYVSGGLLERAFEGDDFAATRSRLGTAALAAASVEVSSAEGRILVDVALSLLKDGDAEEVARWLVEHVDMLSPSTLYAFSRVVVRGGRAPEVLLVWAREQVMSGAAFTCAERSHLVTTALDAAPKDERRALAARFVGDEGDIAAPGPGDDDSDSDTIPADPRRSWALLALLGGGGSRAADERALLAGSLFAHPKNRPCFLASESLVRFVLPAARAALARGELGFPQARRLVSAMSRPADETSGADGESTGANAEPVIAPLDAVEMAGYEAARAGHRFEGPGLAFEDLDVIGRDTERGQALMRAIVAAAARKEPSAVEVLKRELFFHPTRELVAASEEAFPTEDDDVADPTDSVCWSIEHAEDMLDAAERGVPLDLGALPDPVTKLVPFAHARATDPLIPQTDVRSMLRRAVSGLDEPGFTSGALLTHRRAAVVLAATASVLYGDTSPMPALAEAIDWGLMDDDLLVAAGECITEMVALSRGGDKTVAGLAKSTSHAVRAATARGLRASDPASRAILLRLVTDDSARVRNAAKGSLGEGAVPWWVGIFSRDPTEMLSDEEAAAHSKVLATIANLLGPPARGKTPARLSPERIMKLSRSLPAALACDLARQQGRDPSSWHVSPWVFAVMRREGAEDVLADLVEARAVGAEHDFHALRQVAKGMPRAAQSRLALRALRIGAYGNEDAIPFVMELVKGLLRPADAAAVAQELVEIAANDEEAFALACGSFVSYFGRLRAAPPVLVDWALGQIARDEEDDIVWPDQLAKAVLSRAPRERVKPAALAALGSKWVDRKQWALGELLGRLHDSSVDGPKAARVRAFYEEPAYRDAFLTDRVLVFVALPLARADLAAGRLEFASALAVAKAVVGSARGLQVWQAKAKRPRVTKPLTAEERAAYLEARAAFRFEGETWHMLDYDVVGSSSEVGQAHLAAAIAAVEEGDHEAADALGRALYKAPEGALLDAGMAMAKLYADVGLPELLRRGLEEAHVKLGIVLEEPFRRREGDEE